MKTGLQNTIELLDKTVAADDFDYLDDSYDLKQKRVAVKTVDDAIRGRKSKAFTADAEAICAANRGRKMK